MYRYIDREHGTCHTGDGRGDGSMGREIFEVRIGGRSGTPLHPSDLALTDGSTAPVQVRVWALSYRLRPYRLVIAVDRQTAAGIARFHRVRWVALTASLLAAASAVALLATALTWSPWRMLTGLPMVLLLGVAGGASFLAVRLRPPRYPECDSRGELVIADVDGPAATEWAGRNAGRIVVERRWTG